MSDPKPTPVAGLLADLAAAGCHPPAERTSDPYGQQRLYERWLKRPAWRLRDQAIPLLLGIDPESWATAGPAEARLWAAVQAAVAEPGGLRVTEARALPEDWCVEPSELCRWATGQGITLPGPFVTLMEFIRRAIKSPLVEMAEPAEAHRASIREQVLGAALNVLAKCPEQCYDAHGLASGALIAERIAAQSMRWFDAPEAPMTAAEMATMIDRWLE